MSVANARQFLYLTNELADRKTTLRKDFNR